MRVHRRSTQRIRELQRRFFAGIGVPEAKPFVPDPFQVEAIASLEGGTDTLVIAPTGAGKTYIALEGIARVVRQGKRAMYTAPLKALSNAKYAELKRRFEPEFSVGILTGDRKIEAHADIVVATTEIYRNELYGSAGSYGLVVLDELHYLADPQRGPVWEESIILSPRTSTLLMLSASISNARDVAEWIQEIRGKPVKLVTVKGRPVELRYGFLHPTYGVIPLADENGDIAREVVDFYSRSGELQFRLRGKNRRRSRGRGRGGHRWRG